MALHQQGLHFIEQRVSAFNTERILQLRIRTEQMTIT